MACDYEFLEGAREDLEAIVSYVTSVSGGPSAASALLDELEHQIALVCETPTLYGVSRLPELAALGYRVMHVKNYVALYLYRDGVIVVAHVFHQRQDYARLVTG